MHKTSLLVAVLLAILCSTCVFAQVPNTPQSEWERLDGNKYKRRDGPQPPVFNLNVPLTDSHAIDVDEYGRCYLADYYRKSVMRFGVTGQLEKLWLEGFDYGEEKWSCRDITVAPGEQVYVTPLNYNNPLVKESSPGKPKTCYAYYISSDEDGAYYIGCGYRSSYNISGYSPNGELKASWEVPRIRGIDVGPDHNIYALQREKQSVLVYSPNGQLVREIDLTNCSPQIDLSDSNIAVDTNGDIYWRYIDEIVRVSSKGKLLGHWSGYAPRTPMGGSAWIRDFTVRNGLIYALVGSMNSVFEIQAFTPDGHIVARYVSRKLEINMPAAIAVQADGSYIVDQYGSNGYLFFDPREEKISTPRFSSYVSSITAASDRGYYMANGNSVIQLDTNGKYIADVHKSKIEEMNGNKIVKEIPYGTTIDPGTGNLWVITWDGGDNIIFVYGPDNTLIKRMPLTGYSVGYSPGSIAVDPSGFFYISAPRYNRILKFDFNGHLVSKLGGKGDGLGQLRYPTSMVLDSERRLYVADTGNSRIQVFSPDGAPLGCWGKRGSGDGELDRPLGLAIGPGNVLWVSDTHNDRIVLIPLDGLDSKLTKDIKPAQVAERPKRESTPAAGRVDIEGIVVAGTDEFTDYVYIESPNRIWGVRAVLPQGFQAKIGERCRVTGRLELSATGSRSIIAEASSHLSSDIQVLEPLGMANMYVGDGFRPDGKPTVSNLNILVRTWGSVVAVDPVKKRFFINDGSAADDKYSLIVSVKNLRNQFEGWPQIGDYASVTGISEASSGPDGSHIPEIRIRSEADLELFEITSSK
ncbi:MAG: hypothetical protein Q7N50_12115 [Armatimonadota bacterium]|nr:hypothetical protein [Armatimonadota bacterium]